MVKGVNKTVIEVNNTGSKMFEKIIFFVTPGYGNIDPKKLQKAAGEFSFQFSESGTYLPLRRRYKLRRKRLILGILGLVGIAAAVTAIIIL